MSVPTKAMCLNPLFIVDKTSATE